MTSFIDMVEGFFQVPGNESYRGLPVGDGEITQAEATLGVKFALDYIEFIKAFGGSYVGVPIYGFYNSSMLENIDVVALTMKFRADNWPGADKSYVVSMDMAGNPIMVGENAEVFTFDHDFGGYRKLAESFYEFVVGAL